MNNNLRLAATALLSAALLSACGASNKAPAATKTSENIVTLSGKLSGASGGTAVLGGNLASAAVGSDGSFNLTLPSGDQMAAVKKDLNNGFLKEYNCNTNLVSSDTTTQGYAFGALSYNNKDYFDLSADRSLLDVKAGGRVYLYVDKATTITGKLNCSLSPITLNITANITVQPGWNVLGLKGENGTFSLTELTGTMYNTSKQDGSLWVTTDQLRKQIGL